MEASPLTHLHSYSSGHCCIATCPGGGGPHQDHPHSPLPHRLLHPQRPGENNREKGRGQRVGTERKSLRWKKQRRGDVCNGFTSRYGLDDIANRSLGCLCSGQFNAYCQDICKNIIDWGQKILFYVT